IQQIKIKYYDTSKFRFILSLIVTIVLHSFLLFFSRRNPLVQEQPKSKSNNYIISPITLTKTASLTSTIKYKSSSYILTPDIKNGFSAFAFAPQKRFQFHQNENLLQEENIRKQNNPSSQKECLAKLTANQFLSSLAFMTEFRNSDIPAEINSESIKYPIVFDGYGNKYDDLSELIKELKPHEKKMHPTKILLKKRSPNALPIFEIVTSSSNQELDFKVALILSQAIFLKMKNFPKIETTIIVNWGE
ncbi:MAG TPA: hypothetical protein P5239_06260, partial [Victivallales bacterium]|nr:hypothetical protein [Victivallales bacterium]